MSQVLVPRDVTCTFRGLLRNKGFAVAALLTLGLGIGANAAMVSVVSAVLLRSLPYSDPDRIVLIWETKRHQGAGHMTVAAANFEDWRQDSHVFKSMVLVSGAQYYVRDLANPAKLTALRAESDFFNLLGLRPQLGRAFTAAEVRSGSGNVVLLSHAIWEHDFGGQPDVIGRKIRLDNQLWSAKTSSRA